MDAAIRIVIRYHKVNVAITDSMIAILCTTNSAKIHFHDQIELSTPHQMLVESTWQPVSK